MTDVANEPRDEHGRWTTGGAGSPSVSLADASEPNKARASIVADLAAMSAKELKFDPSKVQVTDEERTFELNGKMIPYAGSANLQDGTIKLYTGHISTNEDVPTIMAHEVMHQKFQTFINDYQAERAEMEKDPDYQKRSKMVEFDPNNPVHAAQRAAGSIIFDGNPQSTDARLNFREKGFMRNDGLLNAPYDAKYPLYQAYTKAMMMTDSSDFAKTDGVTSYSRQWWDAWKGQTASTSQAMHETLAEMARLKFSGFPIQHIMRNEDGTLKVRKTPDPNWTKLYKAVEDHWKKRAKK